MYERGYFLKRTQALYAVFVLFSVVLIMMGCSKNTPRAKHFTVGIVNPSSGLKRVVEGFKDGMAQRGYTEGKNITYIYEGALGSKEKITPAAKKIIASNVDLIYTLTTPGTKKVKEAVVGTGIPVVFAPVFSPVDSGIVDSLTHQSENITGIRVRGSSAKALEWLLAIVPSVKNIYIPFHYKDNAANQTVEDLGVAAKKLGITLTRSKLTTVAELDMVMANIPQNVDAIWVTHSHLIASNIEKIVEAANRKKLPVAASSSLQDFGVLVSYGIVNYKLGQQVSRLADQILKGASAKDIPVESSGYHLGINLQAGKKLGIRVPDHILKQAEFIVR